MFGFVGLVGLGVCCVVDLFVSVWWIVCVVLLVLVFSFWFALFGLFVVDLMWFGLAVLVVWVGGLD